MRFSSLRYLMILALLLGLAQLGSAQSGKGFNLATDGSDGAKKGNRYALLIGIQNYKKGIRPLQYTQNDVDALYKALVDPKYGGFPKDNVVVLADNWPDKPSSAEINKKLNWLQIMAKNPEDLVLIYFSGHGDSKRDISYLLTLDTDPNALDLTGFPVETFNRLVKEIPARKKIIFLDACHSGGISMAARGAADGMSPGAFRKLHDNSEGEVRLLSCRQGELSYETEKLGNGRGIFSHFLVESLTSSAADSDRNGFTTASEVEDYVTLKVQNWAAKQGWRQSPVAERSVSGKIILSGRGVARTSNSDSAAEAPTTSNNNSSRSGSHSSDARDEFAVPRTAAVTQPNPAGPAREIVNKKDGQTLLLVPAGSFIMGSNDGDDDEKPQHQVNLPAYYIGKTEVTNAQFRKFVEATGYDAGEGWKEDAAECGEQAPVQKVSWYDANAYCQWAGLRLPTEQEWEKAARGTDGRKYPWGKVFEASRVWYGENSGKKAQAVGSKRYGASPYGCLDMAGNVYEWTNSWYEMYPGGNSSDYFGTKSKVLRGGSWGSDYTDGLRSADRGMIVPTYRSPLLGFRCARTP